MVFLTWAMMCTSTRAVNHKDTSSSFKHINKINQSYYQLLVTVVRTHRRSHSTEQSSRGLKKIERKKYWWAWMHNKSYIEFVMTCITCFTRLCRDNGSRRLFAGSKLSTTNNDDDNDNDDDDDDDHSTIDTACERYTTNVNIIFWPEDPLAWTTTRESRRHHHRHSTWHPKQR